MNASWPTQLKQALISLRKADPTGRLAILGIGQELRGDDAAGLLVARGLLERITNSEQLLIIEAGPAPENFTGPLRRFNPGLVLLVDAARMDAAPGEIRWLALEDTEGVSSSTHTLPPSVLGGYLNAELGCEVALLGIEPEALEFGAGLSPAVAEAVKSVINALSAEIAEV